MQIETWYRIYCTYCELANWIYDGDPSDLTRMDLCGFFCFNCKEAYSLDGNNPCDHDLYEVGLERPT